MTKLLLLLILAAAPSWAINCSGLVVDEVTSHSLTVHLTTDTTIFFEKLRYGVAALTENTQGTPATSISTPAGDPVRHQLTGLSPSTAYLIGFSVSGDGATYCPELTTSVTTPVEDASVLPLSPTDWNTNAVKPQGGTIWNVNSCATLDAAFKGATHTAGTALADTIALAPGLNCHVSDPVAAPDTIWHFNPDGRVGAWTCCWTASGNTMTSSIAHGLHNGDIVYFGGQFGYSSAPAPIAWNHPYYVVNATATTIQVSTTNGGSVLALTSVGSQFLVSKGQPCLSEILVTTQGSLNTFPPEGVRTDDTHYAYATLTNDWTFVAGHTRAFDLSYGTASCVRFDNIRFVDDNRAAPTDPDPDYTPAFFNASSGTGSHDVTFDRIVAKGANDAPNRTSTFIYPFDGARMAIVNSYAKDISYWVPFTDSPTSVTSTTFTIGSGFAYRGAAGAPCALSATATISAGATTGAFYAYVNPTTCAVYVLTDPSLTLSCSGCTQVTAPAPTNYPLSGAGKFLNIAIGFGAVTGGAFTSFINANDYGGGGCCFGQQASGSESSSALVAWDKGPGPTKVENNSLLNVIGIPLYVTGQTFDSGGTADDPSVPMLDQPSNIIIRRNTIAIDNAHISSQPGFNGKGVWGGRNAIECKWCLKALITGNVINNLPRTNIQVGSAFLYTPLSSTDFNRLTATTNQDIETSFNTVNNSSQAYLITTRYPGSRWAGFPARRIWFHDNVFTLNGKVKFKTQSDGNGDFGILQGGYDIRFDHNTVAAMIGSSGLLANVAYFRFGNLNWSNNLTFINDTNGWHGLKYSDPTPTNPIYDGLLAKAALDAVAPNYFYAGNAFLCGYLDTSTLTEMNQSQCNTVRTAYGALTQPNYWASGANLAARLAAVKFYSYSTVGNPVDLHLSFASPFVSGGHTTTDGLDTGANIDALNAAQGQVSNLRVTAVTSSSAIVNFLAPDSFACTVDWSTSGTLVPFTRVANASSGRIQAVTLSGLPLSAVIFYRVNCASQQPSGGFRTH